MRQIALIPSGCNKGKTTNVATSDAKYLYFASTLAVYVMNKETFAIEKILSSSERPIRDITVSPHGNNFLATSSVDGIMTCWNVETEEIYCQVRSPVSTDRYILDWDPHTPDRVLMVTCVGVLKCSTWTVADDVGSMTVCFQLNKGGSVGTAAKWNPRVVDQLAIGTSEGHVILFDVAKKQKGFLQAGSTGLSVVDLQWDRLSSIYLLVAYQNYVSLWDTEAKAEMHVFESQGTRITSIGWLDWTAGNFISTNALTGVVKVWNASQKAPLDTLRVTNSGVLHCHMEAGSHRALMSCGDGNFQVYNLTRKRVEFDVGAGHTETIFDTVFSNTNPDLFASCSYDGTIKLWNTSDQRLRKTIHIADTAIYKLSWNHNDSIIACCSFNGNITLCCTDTGRILATYSHHGDKSSFCVQWSALEQDLLCSTSVDCTARVFSVDSAELFNTASPLATTGSRKRAAAPKAKANLLANFRHPAAVFGCAWSPHNKDLIATCCMDKEVRVWEYQSETCVYKLSGHTGRTFNVAWSPSDPSVLGSTSDDWDARIWRIDPTTHTSALAPKQSEKALSCVVLKGHSDNVRALSFNSEIGQLCITGSWDSTVRAWNISTGECLEVAHAHVADVYAMSSHPRRPFNYVSSSRDTTMRLWELEGAVRKMRMTTVAQLSFHGITGVVGSGNGNGKGKDGDGNGNGDGDGDDPIPPMREAGGRDDKPSSVLAARLYGPESAALHKELCKRNLTAVEAGTEPSLELTYAYAAVFNFYCGPNGSTDLWSVVTKHVKAALEGGATAPAGKKVRAFGLKIESSRVFHESEIVARHRSAARQLESARMQSRKAEVTGKAAEQLALAAYEYAKMGDFTEYCGIMVSLGRWKDALALAPAVSMDYWKELTGKFAEKNAAGAAEDVVPFLVGIGAEAAAGECLFERGDYGAAMVVAKGAEDRVSGSGVAHTACSGSGGGSGCSNNSTGTEAVAERRPSWQDSAKGNTGVLPALKSLPPLRKELSPPRTRLEPVLTSAAKYAASSSSSTGEEGQGAARQRTSFVGADGLRERRGRVLRAAAKNAAQLMVKGEPVLAAAQYLAVGELATAVRILTGSGEPDMAFAVARCVGITADPACHLELADALVSYGQVAMARSVLVSAQPFTGDERLDVDARLAMMLRRYAPKSNATVAGTMTKATDEVALEAAVAAAGLKPAGWWAGRAKEELAVGADVAGLRCLVVAGGAHAEAAARQGLALMGKAVRDPLLLDDEVSALLGVLQYLDAKALPDGQKQTFLSHMLWFSAHAAAHLGDWETGHSMLAILTDLVKRQPCTRFPLPLMELRFQQLFFSVASGRQDAVSDVRNATSHWPELQEAQKTSLQGVLALMSEAVLVSEASGRASVMGAEGGPYGAVTVQIHRELVRLGDSMSLPSLQRVLAGQLDALESAGAIGLSVVSGCGSSLPTPNQLLKRARSILSGRKIMARGKLLDDGISIVSFNEFLRWRRVCTFSPTLTGAFI